MPCTHAGNPELYGLGIRLSLYTLWILVIFADAIFSSTRICSCRVPVAGRVAHAIKLFAFTIEAAVFVALIIQSVSVTLNTLDLYILGLLVLGRLLFHVPVYLIKILTCGFGNWDMARLRGEWYCRRERRYRLVENSVWMGFRFGYLIAVCGWMLWYWAGGIWADEMGEAAACERYGFLFGRVQLEYEGMVAWHVIIVVCMLLGAVCAFLRYVGRELVGKKKYRHTTPLSLNAYNGLRYFRFVCHAVVASVVIAATELTIQYNEIPKVNDLSTSAQLIPFICTIAVAIWLMLESLDIYNDSCPSRDRYWSDRHSYSSYYDADSTRSGRSRARRQRRLDSIIDAIGETLAPGVLPRPPDGAHL